MIAWLKRILGIALCAASLQAAPLRDHSVRIECGFVFGEGRISSMGEHLRDGDIVRVLAIPMVAVREHQTIEVETLGWPVPRYCHEVIAVRRAANGGPYFIPKGTANREPDALHVTAAEYRGVLDIPLIQHIK